jgi:hypothetical protein
MIGQILSPFDFVLPKLTDISLKEIVIILSEPIVIVEAARAPM